LYYAFAEGAPTASHNHSLVKHINKNL